MPPAHSNGPLRLAKPHLDIGLFTNELAPQLDFWRTTVGVRFDHRLKMDPGWFQHRFDAHGSVIKVNYRRKKLVPAPSSGFTRLRIACADGQSPWAGQHPGGDAVEVVQPGEGGIVGIGVTISSPDPSRLREFYRTALSFDEIDDTSLRCGDSVVDFVEGAGGSALGDFAAPGFRYLTMQVFDADRAIAAVAEKGGRVVRKAVNFAGVARYGFISDPDGNWTEISARTSLTGVHVS